MSKGLRRRTTIALFVLAITLPSHGAPGELTHTKDSWWSELVEALADWTTPWSQETTEIEGVPLSTTNEPSTEQPAGSTIPADQTGGGTETYPGLDPHG